MCNKIGQPRDCEVEHVVPLHPLRWRGPCPIYKPIGIEALSFAKIGAISEITKYLQTIQFKIHQNKTVVRRYIKCYTNKQINSTCKTASRVSGGGGGRTRVQTRNPRAFYTFSRPFHPSPRARQAAAKPEAQPLNLA